MTHKLKTDPMYFEACILRLKMFEIRLDDRHFEVGDTIILEEFDRRSNTYTGQKLEGIVVYKLSDFEGLTEGWCALSMYWNDFLHS